MKKFNILSDFPLRYHHTKQVKIKVDFIDKRILIPVLILVNKKFCENIQKVEKQDRGKRCIKKSVDVVCQ